MATGQEFSPMPEPPQQSPQNASLADDIKNLQNTWPVIHKDMRDTYKKYADKRRVLQKEFQVGEVYLST